MKHAYLLYIVQYLWEKRIILEIKRKHRKIKSKYVLKHKCVGRIDSNFSDGNETVVEDIIQSIPGVKCMEMETYTLFHLAHCSKVPIYAGAAAMVVAHRKTGVVVEEEFHKMSERIGCLAVLRAIKNIDV